MTDRDREQALEAIIAEARDAERREGARNASGRLLETAARAAHGAYREERAGGKLHAPEECPCRDGHDWPTPSRCRRCGVVFDPYRPPCHACRPALRPWDALTESARETFREQARPIVAVLNAEYANLLAEMARDEIDHAACHVDFDERRFAEERSRALRGAEERVRAMAKDKS